MLTKDEARRFFPPRCDQRHSACWIRCAPRTRAHVGASALKDRLPVITYAAEEVPHGFLISYGQGIPDFFRRTVVYTDKVLKGAKPADLPVEQPTKFKLVLIPSRWGDAGWGRLVADDKHDGRFGDELVDAVVELLRDRWRPNPNAAWVTCVPSKNNPDLMPDFSRRLAKALNLPFLPVVKKVKDNHPQKGQQNSYHQCRNLDGVFAIDGQLHKGAVLLIDDVVDSKWTLTVIAALLRQAGSGPVFPFALTTSSIGA